MSTSEAQVIARALFDSLTGSTVQALRAAANAAGDRTAEAVVAALPAETSREIKNLVLALGQDGRLDSLAAVATAFEQMTQRAGAPAMTGEVISAVALDDAQRERISRELTGRYGADLTLRFSIDESLIGGLIIRVGDQVLDTSLRTRMAAVQRNMMSS